MISTAMQASEPKRDLVEGDSLGESTQQTQAATDWHEPQSSDLDELEDGCDGSDGESFDYDDNYNDLEFFSSRAATPVASNRTADARMDAMLATLPQDMLVALERFRRERTVKDPSVPITADKETDMDELLALALQLFEQDPDKLFMLDELDLPQEIVEYQRKRLMKLCRGPAPPSLGIWTAPNLVSESDEVGSGTSGEGFEAQPWAGSCLRQLPPSTKLVRVFTPDHTACTTGICTYLGWEGDNTAYNNGFPCDAQPTPQIFKSLILGEQWRQLGLPKPMACDFRNLEALLLVEVEAIQDLKWWEGRWLTDNTETEYYKVFFEEVDEKMVLSRETGIASSPEEIEREKFTASEQDNEEAINIENPGIPSILVAHSSSTSLSSTFSHEYRSPSPSTSEWSNISDLRIERPASSVGSHRDDSDSWTDGGADFSDSETENWDMVSVESQTSRMV